MTALADYALAPYPLSAEAIAAICVEAGYRVIAQHETAVVADRPLPGGTVGDVRSLVFTRPGPWVGWVSSCYVRRALDLEPLTYASRCVTRSQALVDDIALAIWIGGASSIPADARETAALVQSA